MPARPPWTQKPKEVLLVLPLDAPAVKARDIVWKLTTKDIDLRLKGAAEPLLAGTFFHPVRPDDSTWELEDAPGGGKQIRIGFAKARPNIVWDCCFLDEVDETITHRCFMDVSIGGRPMGRVVYGLYGNAYPKTVENFRCLCTGERGSVRVRKKAPLIRLHYKGTTFFRVVPGFICQAGDVTRHPENLGGYSIYGQTFDDEGLRVKHKGAGDLVMANAGIPHNNQSQFAVAMQFLPEFEKGYMIFGKVLDGMDLLRVMDLEGSGEGITKRKISIDECGELDATGRPLVDATAAAGKDADSGPVVKDLSSAMPADAAPDDDGVVLEDEPGAPQEESDDEGPVIEEVDAEGMPVLEVQ